LHCTVVRAGPTAIDDVGQLAFFPARRRDYSALQLQQRADACMCDADEAIGCGAARNVDQYERLTPPIRDSLAYYVQLRHGACRIAPSCGNVGQVPVRNPTVRAAGAKRILEVLLSILE
jgi:hypothetical protein